MNHSPNRKKKCEYEIDKQNYMKHLNRLERLRDGRSPQQLKRENERKKVNEAICTLRKMHTNNRNFKIKEIKQTKKMLDPIKLNRVHSVVKKQFSSPPLPIAPKHKPTTKQIDQENCRMFDRLVHAKSQFNFHAEEVNHKTSRILPNLYPIDFSNIYNTSRLRDCPQNALQLKLGKAKKLILLKIDMICQQLIKIVKDSSSQYVLEGFFMGKTAHTTKFIPNDHQFLHLNIKIPKKVDENQKIYITFNKILDSKQLFKGFLQISIKQLFQIRESTSLSTQMYDKNGKIQGKLTLLSKKNLTSNKMKSMGPQELLTVTEQ